VCQPASARRFWKSTSSLYTKKPVSIQPTAAAASRRTASAHDCPQSTSRTRVPVLCTLARRARPKAAASAVVTLGNRHAEACGVPSGRRSAATAQAARPSCSSASRSAAAAPGISSESSFRSRQ